MMKVGINANTKIVPSCEKLSADTAKSLLKNGTNNTNNKNTIPAANAPTLAMLLLNPILKMESSLRQLNPWNKRAKVRVAKAIVLAKTASPVFKPMWKAVMVQIAMNPP